MVAALEKVHRWLKARSFSLSFVKRFNDVCFHKKRVRIQETMSESSQVTTALHECGHILIFLARKRLVSRDVAGASYNTWLKLQKSSSKDAQLLCLQEEMVAWDRGMRLAKRLKIRVRVEHARLQRTRSLMSYVRATSKKRSS